LGLLPVLAPVLVNFTPRAGENSAAKLSSAEVKFDIPLPAELSYEQAETLLQKLALFIVPYRNRYAGITTVSSEKFRMSNDRAENGKYTLYIGQHRRLPYEENFPKKNYRVVDNNSTWQGIVYLKAFYDADGNLGPWHIRFEVSLSAKALDKIGGNNLSFDVDAMQERLAMLALSDFWRIEALDWKRFIDAAQASYERIRKESPHKRGLMAAKISINLSGEIETGDEESYSAKVSKNKSRRYFMYTVRRKSRAFAIVRWLNDKKLRQKLWKKKFSKPVDEEFSNPPASKDMLPANSFGK
jgi:hypothetical protein